ncbi:MAG: hypothetical protein ACT4O9_13180 [Blastocatellia bacterium]
MRPRREESICDRAGSIPSCRFEPRMANGKADWAGTATPSAPLKGPAVVTSLVALPVYSRLLGPFFVTSSKPLPLSGSPSPVKVSLLFAAIVMTAGDLIVSDRAVIDLLLSSVPPLTVASCWIIRLASPPVNVPPV